MKLITSVTEMQFWAEARRSHGRRVALVPTMGALHAGHVALVEKALEIGDDVIVSVFVNPTQFGPGEDFESYPRALSSDVARLEQIHTGITVFAPGAEEMYPGGRKKNRTWVYVEELDRHLCGRFRPGHFRGVTTVVMKLFHACKPHVAVFGLKDAQQFVILRRMVADMLMDVELVGVPTVRESDGLAYSSRNAYLTPAQRASATVLSTAVRDAERRILRGEQRSEALVESMRSILEGADHVRTQYAEIVDAEMLQPLEAVVPGRRVLAAVAAFVGETRLIDSVFVEAPDRSPAKE